ELVSRIMSDVEGVRNLVGTGLVHLVGGFLTAAIALILLIRIDLKLTGVAIIPLIFFAGISLFAFKKIRPIFRERGKINARVTGRLVESLAGIRVIKGFNAEENEEKAFAEGIDEIFNNVRRTMTTTSLVTSLATLLMGAASVSIMGVGVTQIIDGALTVGEFFAFTFYLAFLVTPIIQMSNIGTQITEAFAGLDRTEEILNLEREGEEKERTHVFGTLEGEIRFENVSFSYASGKEVLHEVDMIAPAGTVTAFVGSSGSGKTTMAGLAAAFLKPKKGVVRVDGQDLSCATLDSYRKQLGLVLQDDFLFEGTIRENIRYAKSTASDDELQNAVDAAHVREFASEFEEGLDTLIGERGVKLSGGQRQRVAIARALLANPRVLVLDEATSNLDTQTEAYIQESLAHLMKGRTTLVIAHRLSTIQRADQIIVLEAGRIVERGKHAELLARKGRYFELYTYQARI
ncbi:MAG: ABC transporter ATP-binding protein, partial [Planctomycetota bacterium]|nr:ABC transporter ATP-binding protein [Planctomycetota bacterium]